MSKIYFEMTETERELTFLGQTVDYAGTRFAEGLGGIYEGLTTKEVIDIQSKIADHLFEAGSLIAKLLEGESKLEGNEVESEDTVTNKSEPTDKENPGATLTFSSTGNPVHSKQKGQHLIFNTVYGSNELNIIKDCRVYRIEDVENSEQCFFGTEIVLFNEQTGKYINLFKDDDGDLSMSQWY